MDFEDFGDLSDREVNAIGTAFLDELQRLTGIKPMVYTDSYSAEELWNRSFSSYPLWVANYEGTKDPETGVWDDWVGSNTLTTAGWTALTVRWIWTISLPRSIVHHGKTRAI